MANQQDQLADTCPTERQAAAKAAPASTYHATHYPPSDDTSRSALSAEQVAHYHRNGYLMVEGIFSPEEISNIKTCVPGILTERNERTILELSNASVRSVNGIHQHSMAFSNLARHPRIVAPVQQLLDHDVYVYQSKLNTKAAFEGDAWPWHQDYVYWLKEDSMPRPQAITAAVFLDDVTEFNGPMMLLPGSHHAGVLNYDTYDGKPPGYESAPGWIPNVVAKMKYTIDREALVRLAQETSVVAPKGRTGAVLFFDCNVAHASPPNLSPFERTLALFTYNRVDNAPAESSLHRPEFLVERDIRPITSVSDNVFLAGKA